MGTIVDRYITQTRVTQENMTPEMAVEMLRQGNTRFVENKRLKRDPYYQVQQTARGQFPFAAVLGCIDSRVSPEIIFDQGIGDIFTVRIAGNFVNRDILGSLEFACKVSGAKAILVLGHTHCEAIKGACDNVQLGNLTGMLNKLNPAVEAVTDERQERTSANPGFVKKVADMNVKLTIKAIKEQSPVLREMSEKKEIVIIGGMYDVENGGVNFTIP